ncbi:transcriptional regulator [Moorella thermoacetica]|nr:helix-turn-helix transcriptional regulator [Moorella thermoacetica]GLI17727.1 transcriptional regulator [Moorella thermoacetica]
MGCILKQIRASKNLSQYQLSKKSGVAQSYIHDIESGAKSPTLRTLEKLAAALEVPLGELLGEEEGKKAV